MNRSVTNRQLAFLLFGIMVGYGSILLPKILGEYTATGGWVSILLGAFMAFLLTSNIVYLGLIHKNETFFDYSKALTGKYISAILVFFYIVFMFMMSSMITRLSSEVIKQTILLKTPIWVLICMFLLVTYYAVIKDINTIARLSEIYVIVIILFGLGIQFAAFITGNMINLMPYFVWEDLPNYFSGSLKIKLAFSGMAILAVIPFGKKQNNRTFIYIGIMILLIAIFYIIQFESSIAVMGVDSIVKSNDVLFTAVRLIEIPVLQVLRRLDGIFITAFILSVFMNITLYAYGSIFLLSKLFSKIPIKLIALAVLLLSFFVCQLPKTYDSAQNVLENTSLYGMFIISPGNLFILILSKVKKNVKT